MRDYRFRLESGISASRFDELMGIARQYDELKAKEKAFRRGEVDRKGGGSGAWHGVPDPTAAGGMRLASSPYAWKIAAIEQAAAAADPALCKYILANVTGGRRYEDMPVPCGKNQFYRARRNFFEELNLRIP